MNMRMSGAPSAEASACLEVRGCSPDQGKRSFSSPTGWWQIARKSLPRHIQQSSEPWSRFSRRPARYCASGIPLPSRARSTPPGCTGFQPIAEAEGVALADFKQGREIVFDKGVQNKKFIIANGALDCDGIISLPKLKTHGLERLTGCVKNQFGCVPGALKGEFHVKLASAIDFARMLVDLNAFLKPRLYVMDGIIAMEGNGPRGGRARPMKVLLFSADPIALDATVCRMVDISPEFVPTIRLGMEARTGTWKKEEIELIGDPLESFVDRQFDVKREPVLPYSRGKGSGFLRNAIVPRPYIIAGKCTQCGTCVKACPVDPKAVDWHTGDRRIPPSYKYDRCIRCYCCQELCPEGAVELKVPFLRRLLGGAAKE